MEMFGKKYGFNPDVKITRKDWGEHEYRQKEWLSFMEKAGLRSELFYFFKYQFKLNRYLLNALIAGALNPFKMLLLKHKIFHALPGYRGQSKTLLIGKK